MLLLFSLKHWQFPFSMSAFYFAQIYCGVQLEFTSNILIPIINSFSLLFAVFLENIHLILTKDTFDIHHQIKRQNFTKSSKIFRIESDILKKKKISYASYALLGIISSFEIGLMYEFAFLQTYGFSSSQSLLSIIVIWSASKFFSKNKLYSHQILSLCLIALDIIVFYCLDFNNLTFSIELIFKTYIRFFVFFFVYIIASPVKELLEHHMMIIDYISPFRLLFFEGASSLFLFMLYFGIINFVPCKNATGGFFNDLCYFSQWGIFKKDFVDTFSYISKFTAYAWGYIIFGFFMQSFRIQTNKQLSPSHRYMAEMVFSFYWFIHDLFAYYIKYSDYTAYFIFIHFFNAFILVIACLIFNEYVIINLCGLNTNTYIEKNNRAIKEININLKETLQINEYEYEYENDSHDNSDNYNEKENNYGKEEVDSVNLNQLIKTMN